MERWQLAAHPACDADAAVSPACGGRCGTSLVEVLLSTLFVSLLGALSYSFARAALMSMRVQEARSEAENTVATALDLLSREVRMAGFSAGGTALTGVVAAAQDRVEVVADFDGDGQTTGANEHIAYSYSPDKHALLRTTGAASPQPLAMNLATDGVAFSYFDASGQEIAAGQALPLDERRRIHRIDVVLRVEVTNPDPAVTAPLRSAGGTSICLRNQ
jgi:hypothetical protein